MNSALRETAKHPMLGYSKIAVAVLALYATVFSPARSQERPDGATIVNSGSTNTVGWRISVRSDGKAAINGRPFTLTASLAVKLLQDARAARNANALGQPCVKSVSFGTRLNVYYHDWTSPDLSCPPLTDLLQNLESDVAEIEHIAVPPNGLRRVHVPLEPHRIPPTPPPG